MKTGAGLEHIGNHHTHAHLDVGWSLAQAGVVDIPAASCYVLAAGSHRFGTVLCVPNCSNKEMIMDLPSLVHLTLELLVSQCRNEAGGTRELHTLSPTRTNS